MKTKVEALQDNQVKLTVMIDAKDIDNRIKKTYKDFAFKYNFPGFRRGKAPRPVIDNAIGAEAVLATVTDDIIKESYPVAVDDSGIFPISQPEFEDQDSLVEGGKPFSFAATLTTKPEFELESYDPVEIELPGEEATDEEIQMQIDSLREHYFTFEDAAASAKIEEGGTAELAMKAFDDKDEPIDSLTSESRVYTLGSGLYPEEFDTELVGLKKGQKKSIDLEFKGLYTAGLASIAGQTDKVHFDVEVKAVKEKALPEVTDEWATETLGFESLEDLKTRIAESITQSKQEALPRMKENECLHALGERLKGDIPESMTEDAEADLLKNFFQQLQSQGTSLDVYLMQQNITIDQFKDDVKEQATEIAKQDLALDAWARHKGMEVTGKDLTEEFAKSGTDDPKALEAEWRANGQLHTLRQGILRVRAIKDVIDTAIVSEPGSQKETKEPAAKKSATKKTEAKTEDKAEEAKPSAKKASAKKAAAAKTDASTEKKPTTKSAAAGKVTTEKVPAKEDAGE